MITTTPDTTLAQDATEPAPESSHGAAISHSPNPALINRSARPTSAIAITATVMMSAPTRWSLSARGGTVPKVIRLNMSQTPTITLATSVHGTVTPRTADAIVAAKGAPKFGLSSRPPFG